MKLIYCLECKAIINLRQEEKKCVCGKSGGQYVDNINAEIYGPCVPLGFANDSFSRAYQIQKEKNKKGGGGWGSIFEAFWIPENTKSIRRIDEEYVPERNYREDEDLETFSSSL